MKNSVCVCLWFANQALEAAEYYCKVVPNSTIVSQHPMVVAFDLDGTRFMALNGSKGVTFNESVSIVRECTHQEEINHVWTSLIEGGGQESSCGWLIDRFGVSWQILPANLPQLLGHPDKGKSAWLALMKMKKNSHCRIRKCVTLLSEYTFVSG